MADYAHKETDKLIQSVEKKVKKEYALAQKEIERKANKYFAAFAEKDAKKKELVRKGLLSADGYAEWRKQQMLVGQKWDLLSISIAEDLRNANHISNSIVKGYMPEAYALNHNYATYEIETGTGINTSYTLYDRQTVERLLRDNPKLLPDPSDKVKQDIRDKKIMRWSKQKMNSALTQAILQGKSIPEFAKSLRSVTGMEKNAAIRNARTMMTNAQNAGRYDGFRRAKDMGVMFKVVWIATLDNRTRHEHRMLDGQMQEVDEPFNVDGIKIMYPADYGGKDYKVPPDMIYNCRCTIGAAVKGTKLYEQGLDAADRQVDGGLSYDEWKNQKPSYGKQPLEQADKKPKFQFTPAGSLDEAEKYARQYVDESRFGALGVSYKGVDLDVANEINKTIGEFFNTYDVEKFGGITAPAGNTKLGKQIQGATAAYSDIRRSFLLNRNSLKTYDIAEKHFKDEYNAIKNVLAHPERYDFSKASRQLRNVIENSKESGRGTIPQTIGEAINHELGHSLERQIKRHELFSEVVENMPKYNSKLSGYACQDISEYIAESFCSYSKGENIADPVLVKIFKSFER